MQYLFIDESGNLGFGEKSGKFFIITLLLTDDEVPLSRILKGVRKRLGKPKLFELKAAKSSDVVRETVLNGLVKENVQILTIILNKNKVLPKLQKKKDKLYNYVAGQILNELTILDENVNIICDKRSGKRVIRQDFDNYILNKLLVKKDGIRISHFESYNSAGLQAVDFVSWAIFRKHEYGDERFYNIIRDKIVLERKLWEI